MIRFLNHAAFVIEHRGTSLLSDPYLAGSAFDNGWRLLVEEDHPELDAVDFIWFSHEHPDHFSVPFLRSIPEERRGAITVLYQATRDGRVRGFCERLGFRFQELVDGETTTIAPGFSITCGQIPFYDSWLLIDLDGYRVLNTNDCILESPERLSMITDVAPRCDVLFTQFSYANWVEGGAEDSAHRALAEEKLRRVGIQAEAFGPRFVVPFASFVYFAHEENAAMNAAVNTVADCAEYVTSETVAAPVVLAPNEVWDGRTPKDNTQSLAYWNQRYADLRAGRLPVAEPGESVSVAELRSAAAGMCRRVAERNHLVVLKALARVGVLAPTKFRLTDLGQTVSFDWRTGLTETADTSQTSDEQVISLHSTSLRFVFEHDFGVDTLNVNARFDGTVAAKKAMIRNLGVLSLNNTGRYLTARSVRSMLRPEFLKQGLRTTGLVRRRTLG